MINAYISFILFNNYANFDDILAKKTVYKDPVPEPDSQESSFSNANDSWDLDLSNDTKKGKSKDADDNKEKLTSFVPSKGQKMVHRRLKKIGGLWGFFVFK